MIDIRSFNPDVLSCLANLSNDEVFTPPKLANEMLDLLPLSLWSDRNAKFLDPCSKTGVFLREIAKRLLKGLEKEIPDLHDRINHIFKNQIYGIAITELTAHLTRRSVYCSKHAMGKYSVCDIFDDDAGNIRFERTEHTWKDGRCIYCGANQENYDRGGERESYAYPFIHEETGSADYADLRGIRGEILNMKFDVIVGNPPYQLSDGAGGGGSSAIPLYHKFIQQAKKMNPRYLTMIVPSRWFSGGKGLDEFRIEMLTDKRICHITDYFDSSECFPGIDLSGGVCYFLWDRENKGDCVIENVRGGKVSKMRRSLLEGDNDTFIRFNEAVTIVKRIQTKHETSFATIVSSRKPFGLAANVRVKQKETIDTIKIFAYPNDGYIKETEITRNQQWINKYKVMIAKSYGERGIFPYLILSKPFMGDAGTCCSETYLVIGPFKTKKEAKNVISYIQTRLFRFLVLLIKNTQNAPRKVYSLVPMQDFSEPWTDEKLYKKYELTQEEIAFIESMIRPMEVSNNEENV
jgi:site-specific DNA-methyltransferase (adenine-specific)